jgi:hypothetical protein
MVNRDTEFVPIAEIAWKNGDLKNGILAVTAFINPGSYSKALLVSEINHEWHACKMKNTLNRSMSGIPSCIIEIYPG